MCSVTYVHDTAPARLHSVSEDSFLDHTTEDDGGRVYLVRQARKILATLNESQREALQGAFMRVGRKLLASAERVAVGPGWARHTWPRRRYPQQCYSRTASYVLNHPDIEGMQLVHGVASHEPRHVPFDHAWVELPGHVVFDGVVQTFFTRASYYAVMSPMALDVYSAAETRQLAGTHRHPGPWNANWVPTPAQLLTYAATVRSLQVGGVAAAPSVNVGRNR
jgi:hypothetical protein